MDDDSRTITIDSDDDEAENSNETSSGSERVPAAVAAATTVVTVSSTGNLCKVCGAEKAALHYGALSCVGCKGFFRRALLKADQLECTSEGECPVSNLQKIQCRSCRFNKCLKEGMNPAFVRPNRDIPPKPRKPPAFVPHCDLTEKGKTTKTREEWMKKMTVEMRTMLMTLLNIETKIMKGDTNLHASKIYPLRGIDKLRDIIEDSSKLKGKRTEMRYEAYRMAANDELCPIAYRRLIATIDWVDHLSPLLGHLSTDDKIALVKSAFAPLMVFNFAARTAEVSNDRDVLCLCNFSYVPRNISKMYSDTYHLGNGLVERSLNELVDVYREYGMKEEEIVCVNAMICLNPLAKDLSEGLFEKIVELRNRVSDCLFSIVKEVRLSPTPNVCYGHILMSLSTVSELAGSMSENLQFAQTFSVQGEVALLTDLFGCFTVEPFFKEIDNATQMASMTLDKVVSKEVATQTARIPPPTATRKRVGTVDEDEIPARQNFRLLQPPTNFYLTEMFDDLRAPQTSSHSNSPNTYTNHSPSTSSPSPVFLNMNNTAEQQLSRLNYDASTIPIRNSASFNGVQQTQNTTQMISNQPSTSNSSSQHHYTYEMQSNRAGPSTSYNFPAPSTYPPLNAGYTPNINYPQLYQPPPQVTSHQNNYQQFHQNHQVVSNPYQTHNNNHGYQNQYA